MQNLIEFFTGTQTGIAIIVGAVMSVIQVSKININPWTWVGRMIQKAIGVKDLADRMDKRDAIDARSRIIRFDDECINQIRHSKAMFDAVLIDCDSYEEYTTAHPEFRNSIAEDSIRNIKEIYHKLKAENDFLVVRKKDKEC